MKPGLFFLKVSPVIEKNQSKIFSTCSKWQQMLVLSVCCQFYARGHKPPKKRRPFNLMRRFLDFLTAFPIALFFSVYAALQYFYSGYFECKVSCREG